MEFRILGPVGAYRDGRPVALGSDRQRFVLAVLLLNADKLVKVDSVIDALWVDPPATAKAQVHNMVSRLRAALRPDDLIVSRPGGYELQLRTHVLDVRQFRTMATTGRQAVAQGGHAFAASMLGEALTLWHGPALADLPDRLAAGMRTPLHDERLEAVEARADAQLALHLSHDVLRELPVLIAEHPLREGLYARQMLALASVGRRAEALDCYRGAYRRFVDELGVEPGQALRDIERRILRDEVPPTVSVPRQLPPSLSPLTGRDVLLTEITEALLRRDVPVVLLTGPGGVGKTALALATAHLTGPQFPDGQLYADLRAGPDRTADPFVVLGRFLRALGMDGAKVPDDPDERIAAYRSLLAHRRVLVMLDNAAGEEQVRLLLPGSGGSRTVVTSRHRLGALVGPVRWTVPTLDTGEALALLGRVIGHARLAAEPDAAKAVARLCAYLPLALVIAAARLAVHPEWTLAEFGARLTEQRGRLDELRIGDLNVRASVAVGYDALGAGARRLLRRLGLVRTVNWPAWIADALAGEPAGHLLDELVDAHLIQSEGRDPLGQARFRLHELVADFAREHVQAEESQPDRRAAVNRMLSGWLSLAVEADIRIPHGLVRGPAVDHPPGPPGVTEIVRERPTEWFEVERQSLADAVVQACDEADADIAGRLALRLCGFLWLRSYDEDWADALRQAVSTVRAAGSEDLLARLLDVYFEVVMQRHRYSELPALAAEERETAERLGDRELQVRALRNTGRAALRLGDLDTAVRTLTTAVAEAREPGLPTWLLGDCLAALGWAHREAGDPIGSERVLAESVDLDRTSGQPLRRALRLYHYALTLTELRRTGAARSALTESLAMTRSAGDGLGCAYLDQALADVDILDGRFGAAHRRLHQALTVLRGVGDADGEATTLRSLGCLATAEGRQPAAVTAFRDSLAIWRSIGPPMEVDRTAALLAEAQAQAAPDARPTARAVPGAAPSGGAPPAG